MNTTVVNKEAYNSNIPPEQLKTKYGLPQIVAFCNSCVISNQRPSSTTECTHTKKSKKHTITFDASGICSACRITHHKKYSIDWKEREQQLIELCKKYKRTDGQYDCLVPGSGGKDSFFAAHVLKYKYGMNPLTITWAPHLYTDWGWKNQQAWIRAGFDNYLITPNGKIHRLLTRLAVENLFHPFQPFMIGQKAVIPKIAAQLEIPLIFYGENEAEYGNPQEEVSQSSRNCKYFSQSDRSQVYLSGLPLQELNERFGITNNDLDIYLPANPQLFHEKNINVQYLGYYLPWHPQQNYYYAVEHGNFQASPERTAGTYSKYSSIDDKIDDFHYYTTFIKFGIGRATYDAAQEIRNEEITREEGIALVKKFDGEYPTRFEKEIFEYLSISKKEFPRASKEFSQPIMTRDYFFSLADQFRSPHLWKYDHETWKLRHTVHQQS